MSLPTCTSRHKCADGGQGECGQPQGHSGRHLCRSCYGFFGGGEANQAEQPVAAPKSRLSSTSKVRLQDEGDGVTHWHCAHCNKQIPLDSPKCSCHGLKVCSDCHETDTGDGDPLPYFNCAHCGYEIKWSSMTCETCGYKIHTDCNDKSKCRSASSIEAQSGGLRTMHDCFAAALKHIACHGDTNIFPQPLEKWVFGESKDAVHVLESIHDRFPQWFSKHPPFYESTLTPAGNSGFRTATRIEPVWNGYLLALVMSIGDAIENARVPVSRQVVFSCRYGYNSQTGVMLDESTSQDRFNEQCARLAERSGCVLACDIADCYSSISHQRLASELLGLPIVPETARRIMRIIRHLAGGQSRGLPVGGSAARLLAELALNGMDKALLERKIVFCRMMDDYRIFAKDENEARALLVTLSGLLMHNEGLSLQRNKTRILAAPDFGGGARAARTQSQVEADKTRPVKDFLNTLWPFGGVNYMNNFVLVKDIEPMAKGGSDVVARLEREADSASPNTALLKNMIFETHALHAEDKRWAISVMMNKLPSLRGVFPRAMALVRESIDDLDAAQQADICGKVRNLIDTDNHLLRVFCNMSHALRVLGCQPSSENQEACARVYRKSGSQMVKQEAILAMAKLDAESQLRELLERWPDMGPWEKRALLVASRKLGEDGRLWRNQIAAKLTPFDRLVDKWAAARAEKNQPLVPF